MIFVYPTFTYMPFTITHWIRWPWFVNSTWPCGNPLL